MSNPSEEIRFFNCFGVHFVPVKSGVRGGSGRGLQDCLSRQAWCSARSASIFPSPFRARLQRVDTTIHHRHRFAAEAVRGTAKERNATVPTLQTGGVPTLVRCSTCVHAVPARTTPDVRGGLQVVGNTIVPGCVKLSPKGVSPSHGGGQRFESAGAYQSLPQSIQALSSVGRASP